MRKFSAVLLALLCLSLMVRSASAQIGLTLPDERTLGRHGLELAWWGQAMLDRGRDRVQFLVIDEENLYVQSNSGAITAFNAETGQRLWAKQLGRYGDGAFPAASNQQTVLVAVGVTLYALNKDTGEILWQFRLPGPAACGPAVDELHAYIGTLDGSLYAFDLRKARTFFREGKLPLWSPHLIAWRFQAGEEITAPPVVMGFTISFASRDGSLYTVTADRRNLRWQLETGGPILAPVAVSGDALFIASEDFSFYAVDVTSGRVIWEFTSGLPIRQAPIAIGHDLYIMPERGGMYSMAARTGAQQWWQPGLAGFLAATPTRVFASDRQGNVQATDRAAGTTLGTIPLRQFPVRLANERTDRLYLATESGMVICLREQGRQFPIYHRYPERLPLLPEFAVEGAEPDEPEPGTETDAPDAADAE